MITLTQVVAIHDILIGSFGGSKGIRDTGLLEAAMARPYQTFDGIDLYPDPVDKAAALFESIISNHPFIDGNKRTAYVLLRIILWEHQLDILADEDEKYNFVVSAAHGEIRFDQIRDWLRTRLSKRK